MTIASSSSGCHTLVKRPDCRVALARGTFQALAIEHGNAAVHVPDESRRTKRSRNYADRLTANAKHRGEEFMAQVKVMAAHSIVRYQQPPSAALIDCVMRIACHQSRHDRVQDLDVPSDGMMQRRMHS